MPMNTFCVEGSINAYLSKFSRLIFNRVKFFSVPVEYSLTADLKIVTSDQIR